MARKLQPPPESEQAPPPDPELWVFTGHDKLLYPETRDEHGSITGWVEPGDGRTFRTPPDDRWRLATAAEKTALEAAPASEEQPDEDEASESDPPADDAPASEDTAPAA